MSSQVLLLKVKFKLAPCLSWVLPQQYLTDQSFRVTLVSVVTDLQSHSSCSVLEMIRVMGAVLLVHVQLHSNISCHCGAKVQHWSICFLTEQSSVCQKLSAPLSISNTFETRSTWRNLHHIKVFCSSRIQPNPPLHFSVGSIKSSFSNQSACKAWVGFTLASDKRRSSQSSVTLTDQSSHIKSRILFQANNHQQSIFHNWSSFLWISTQEVLKSCDSSNLIKENLAVSSFPAVIIRPLKEFLWTCSLTCGASH